MSFLTCGFTSIIVLDAVHYGLWKLFNLGTSCLITIRHFVQLFQVWQYKVGFQKTSTYNHRYSLLFGRVGLGFSTTFVYVRTFYIVLFASPTSTSLIKKIFCWREKTHRILYLKCDGGKLNSAKGSETARGLRDHFTSLCQPISCLATSFPVLSLCTGVQRKHWNLGRDMSGPGVKGVDTASTRDPEDRLGCKPKSYPG